MNKFVDYIILSLYQTKSRVYETKVSYIQERIYWSK